jgi:hypothetical protein
MIKRYVLGFEVLNIKDEMLVFFVEHAAASKFFALTIKLLPDRVDSGIFPAYWGTRLIHP